MAFGQAMPPCEWNVTGERCVERSIKSCTDAGRGSTDAERGCTDAGRGNTDAGDAVEAVAMSSFDISVRMGPDGKCRRRHCGAEEVTGLLRGQAVLSC